METKRKLFAFKLASREDRTSETRWKAREGRSVAGCTDYKFPGNLRYPHSTFGADRGIYC